MILTYPSFNVSRAYVVLCVSVGTAGTVALVLADWKLPLPVLHVRDSHRTPSYANLASLLLSPLLAAMATETVPRSGFTRIRSKALAQRTLKGHKFAYKVICAADRAARFCKSL